VNLNVTRLITVSAFVVALGLGASQASAQKATFNLPFEARWGNVVLDPGSYTLSAADSPAAIHIYYLHSDAGTQMAVPAIVNNEAVASGRSYLKLANVDGTYYVREYVSGATGRAVKFAIPKVSRRELSVRDRVLATSDF
jgi:hypothetical protein